MKLIADYHIHSKFSKFFHGKNTIEELVRAANAIGLEEIAITDHGFKHLCGTNKQNIKKARQIIDEINTWSSTKVLLGVEADIISEDGTLDIDNETLSMLDILAVGYHKLIKTDFAGFFGNVGKTEEYKRRCTRAYLNAIEKYPVTYVSHLDSILTTDLYEIGKKCFEKGVMIEINNRHTKWTKEQVDELVASNCLFLVNSDAHRREDVGEVDKCFDIITKYTIPTENIVNVKFELSEKSERNIEFDVFYGFYKQQEEKKKLEKLEQLGKFDEKSDIVHNETLSPEMEKALREIAQEKGISYQTKSYAEQDVDSVELTNDEEYALIREAQEFLTQSKISEFDVQNEKLSADVGVIEEDSQPFDRESTVQIQPQTEVLESVLTETEPVVEQQSVVQIVEEPVKVEPVIPVELKPVQEPQPVQVEKKKDDEILNFAVKTNKQTKPKTTASVSKTASSSKSAPKIVVEQNKKPAAMKTTSKPRGGFVNAGGIVETATKSSELKKKN